MWASADMSSMESLLSCTIRSVSLAQGVMGTQRTLGWPYVLVTCCFILDKAALPVSVLSEAGQH